MPEKLSLGGRVFVPVKRSTLRHDWWMTAHLKRTGLLDIGIAPGESLEGFAGRVLVDIISSDMGFLLLGGLMVPEGTAWSPKVAKETAAFLETLEDEKEKRQAQSSLLSLLLPFFIKGLGSPKTSPRSSLEGPSPTNPPLAETGEAGPSGPGARSLEPSPTTTSTGLAA